MTDSELAFLIIKRYKEQHLEGSYKDLLFKIHSVCDAFTWGDTKEGYYFWLNVHDKIRYNLNSFLSKNLSLRNEIFVDLQIFV